jgi:hypothetical protein
MEKLSSAVMGIRKMSVIMFCVAAIIVLVFLHMHYGKEIDQNSLFLAGIVAALGGVHIFKQGQIDAIAKSNGGII